jgi:hypothetical protein
MPEGMGRCQRRHGDFRMRETKGFSSAINRVGQKYGRLTVLERVNTDKSGQARWLCHCDCGSGKLTIASGNHLARGNVRSCGCLRIEAALRATRDHHSMKHGMAKRGRQSSEYYSYLHAKARCENSNNANFADYGGRGIKFLYTSFEQFFADLGPKPPGLTVERINNNGHYQPGNCRWATRLEQGSNKRNNRLLVAFGRIQILSQWAREYGIAVPTLHDRLSSGIPLEHALTVSDFRGLR